MIPSLKFEAEYARSSAALRELMGRSTGNYAVADLTFGSWTPQSLATQLLSQIAGKEFTFKANAASYSGSLGDAMSIGIDHDCKGNGTVLEAVATAGQISKLLKQRPADLYILVPCLQNPWRTADRLLIEYLSSSVSELHLKLVISAPDPTPWPEGWQVSVSNSAEDPQPAGTGDLLSVLPTALAPSVQKAFANSAPNSTIALPNGWALVAPEHRRSIDSPDWKTDPASTSHPALRSFAAYVAYHKAPETTDPWLFGVEAWKQFGSGYHELAVLYIDAAVRAARNFAEKTTFACHGQAMRVAMAAYKDAGKFELPPDVSDETRIFLLETKGWGLVMGGSPKEALPHLREALRLSNPAVIDKAYLFLMNITALSEVRSGFPENALDLEKRIDSLRVERGIDDARLLFVNSLNLARLYRYSGSPDQADFYYRRAFSTVEGARTETDSVNANLSVARIAEGRGDVREAFMCWLRGALHWSANESPEALNWRVQGLVLSKGAVVNVRSITEAYDLVERLASSFLENLEKYAGLCGVHVDLDGARPVRFERPRATPGQAPTRCLGGPGWSAVAAEGLALPRVYGPAYQKLNLWLGAWIRSSTRQPDRESCYWIEMPDGGEIPRTWPDLLESAAEFNLTRINWEGEDLELDRVDLQRLNRSTVAALNPIVSRVEETDGKTTIAFRRYLKPYTPTEEERDVLSAVEAMQGVLSLAKSRLSGLGFTPERTDAVVARLRSLRVLRISRSADGVSIDGLRARALAAAVAH